MKAKRAWRGQKEWRFKTTGKRVEAEHHGERNIVKRLRWSQGSYERGSEFTFMMSGP